MNGIQSYTIDRGRSTELDKTGVGTAQVNIIDTDGTWDPTNTAGSSFLAMDSTALDPLKPASISLYNPVAAEWKTIFRGFVEEYIINVDLSETFLNVQMNLVDGMDIINACEVTPDSTTGDATYAAQAVDDRIKAALADAGWPVGLTNVFSGNVDVKGTTYAPRTSLLSVVQDAADAEFPGVANFFMSKEGFATFHGRIARFDPSNATFGLSQWKAGDITAVEADSTKALIFGFEFARRKSDIINAALATPQDIADTDIAGQVVTDPTSIGIYGTRTWSAENLITDQGLEAGTPDDLDETKKFATYYVDNQADPRSRITQMVFRGPPPGTPGAAKTWQLICGVDISDTIDIVTHHPGGGGFNETFFVEGIHYEVHPLNDTYLDVTLTLDVSPAAYYTTDPFS